VRDVLGAGATIETFAGATATVSNIRIEVEVPDTTAPVISNVAAQGINLYSATINWNTNENSDSQVDYGETIAYGQSTILNPSGVTAHSQGLSGLKPGTVYHYRVKSRDASGNLAISSDHTFTTAPLVISNVAAGAIASSCVTITWNTNVATNSQVQYGTTTAYGQSTTLDPLLVTAHSQPITGLTANTVYHYRVRSRDAANNLVESGDFTFTTGTLVVSNVNVVNITTTSATITWNTNDPTTTQVEYGLTPAYGQFAPLTPSATLATAHSQVLTGLTPGTVYHFRTNSIDEAGNHAYCSGFTFTTAQSVPTDGLANLSYNTANNQITTAGFEYDPAGNQTRAVINASGTQQQYRYDCAGRLAQVLDGSGNVLATYSYGAGNRRLKSVEGGVTKYIAWAEGKIIAEYEAWGTNALIWKTSYVYLDGRLLATTSGADGNETRFHHPDRLEGTRLTTDAGGTVVTEQLTMPFGTMLPFTQTYGGANSYQHPTLSNPSKKRFTSYDRSDVTTLDYAANRSYSSQQGRFTQVDPIEMEAAELDDPQTLNLYTYCGNDPTNHIDPYGLFFGKLFRWIGKAFKFLFKVVAVALVVAAIVLLPTMMAAGGFWLASGAWFGWGSWAAVMGMAGAAGLAGWHNGKLGEIASAGLTALGRFGGGNFRTPNTFPGAVEQHLIPQRGRRGGERRQNPPRLQPWRSLPRRGGREARRQAPLSTTDPSFPDLKDHAVRHGPGMSREEYYRAARDHIESHFRRPLKTEKFRVYNDGQWKWYYVTRVGPDNFIFTSTTANGRVILTHMRDRMAGGGDKFNTRSLRNLGVTLPPGF